MLKSKIDIRKEVLIKRNNVPFLSQKNCNIAVKVLELLLKNEPSSLFCYVSMKSEVDTKQIIRSLFGKTQIFVPHTQNGVMNAVKLDNIERLNSVDKWGNVYSRIDSDTIVLDKPCDITIVPLVAFDKNLNRLGYGAGCYDRYFAKNETYKIGLAFDEQQAEFETSNFDVPLDLIITPTVVLRR